MKKLLILFGFLFFINHVQGQLNWVFDEIDNGCGFLLKTTSGEYALLHGTPVMENFTAVDPNGNTLFTNYGVPLPGNPYFQNFSSLFELPGNIIGAVANIFYLDTLSGLGDLDNAVLLFDQSGQFITLVETQYSDRAMALSDGDFVVGLRLQPYISRMSSDGTKVWEEQLPSYLNDMAVKDTDTLLFLTGQGLIVLDEDGNNVDQFPSLVFERMKTSAQNDIVFVQDDSIYLYSSTYGFIEKQGFLGDNIKDFDMSNGKIVVLTQANFVHVFNDSLVPLSSFQLVENALFSFIVAGPQTVTLAGTERYGSAQSNFGTSTSFLREYGLDGNDFGTSNDIGVVGIEPGPEVGIHEYFPNYFDIILKDLAVTVRNYGSHPVSAFKLNRKNNYNVLLDNISLAPGEEKTFVVPEFKLLYYGDDPAGMLLDFCIWTSHPDFRMDSNADNDSFCMGFLVNNEEAMAQNVIAIYPNPSTDYLNFELRTPQLLQKANFRIYDASGKLVKEFQCDSPKDTFIVPVWDWAAGVYFLQYEEGGEVRAVEQFIVAKK